MCSASSPWRFSLILPFASPKQRRAGRDSSDVPYPYYAGFSAAFVASVLRGRGPGTRVIDPWNGSGTTTSLCARLGYASVGVDLNPAMLVLARARQLSGSEHACAAEMLAEVLDGESGAGSLPAVTPLLRMFTPGTAARLRLLADRIAAADGCSPADLSRGEVSGAASAVLSALFLCARQALDGRRGSNPTWVRLRGGEPVRMSWEAARSGLSAQFQRQFGQGPAFLSAICPAELRAASAEALPFASGSFGLLIGSPPYLTRQDYAVASTVELGLMGWDAAALRALRLETLGTTAVNRVAGEEPPLLSAAARAILEGVAAHASAGSGGYYLLTTADFLRKFQRSLLECARVLEAGAEAVLVVQDSLYKDLHLDLAAVVSETFALSGLSLISRQDFQDPVSLRRIRRVPAPLAGRALPVESVLAFSKAREVRRASFLADGLPAAAPAVRREARQRQGAAVRCGRR